MDPRVYLEVADLCAGCAQLTETPDRWLRTAINRSYYGAYSVAHAFVVSVGCQIPKLGSSHALVRDILDQSAVPELQNAGDRLRELYEWRIKADYRHADDRPERPKNVRDAIRLGRQTIEFIDAAGREPRRAEVVATLASVLVSPLIAIHRSLGGSA